MINVNVSRCPGAMKLSAHSFRFESMLRKSYSLQTNEWFGYENDSIITANIVTNNFHQENS